MDNRGVARLAVDYLLPYETRSRAVLIYAPRYGWASGKRGLGTRDF